MRRTEGHEIAYVISLVGTGGKITTFDWDEMVATYQSNLEVSPRPTCRPIQPSEGNLSKLHEIFEQIEHTGRIREEP